MGMAQMAYLLILVSTFTSLLEGILIKKYNSRHSKGGFIFTALVSLFSMFFFLITDKGGFHCPAGMIWYALVAGVLYCSASFLTFVALGCGSFAMSMLILSYSIVFSIGYGLFFLKEAVSVYTYLGLAVIMVSLYLVREDKGQEKSSFSVKWLICILVSTFGSGMFSVVSRIQQIRYEDSCTNEFMVLSLGFSALILFVIGLGKDGKDLKYILKYGGLYAGGAGISNGTTNLISFVLYLLLPITIVSPLRAGAKIVLSFLVSRLIFKETFLKRQAIGVFLGAVALVLLNL